MQVLWRLVLAHFLTDFTFQTNFVANWKREKLWGALFHSGLFFVCGAALCFNNLGEVWFSVKNIIVLKGWVTLAILTLLHFIEDEWRVWTIKKMKSPDILPFFLWDQFIHLMFIFVFAPKEDGLVSEKWVLLAILLILVTHFTTIMIYYIEKDIFGKTKVLTQEKYYSMSERVVTGMILLLPGWWALGVLVFWLARAVINRVKGNFEFSWTNIIVGNLLAIVFGFCARLIYYS